MPDLPFSLLLPRYLSRIPRTLPAPALLVAIPLLVSLLLVPWPPTLLDGLVTLQCGLAISFLAWATLVQRVPDGALVPALVLGSVTTRLCLNVATTRQILGEADAGTVIASVGASATATGVASGVAVLAAITLVQFFVVTRGGERLAEVAARFALDGMAARQAGIDAEVRQGGSPASARAMARRLQQESRMLGSLDGTLRFVRGDAAVAIALTAVNLIGGAAVAMSGQLADLDTMLALAIGDGLVQQVPALLTGTGVALLVMKRTADDGSVPASGGSLVPALAVGVAGAAALALLPGVSPAPPLVAAGALAAAAARARWGVPGAAIGAASSRPDDAQVRIEVPPGHVWAALAERLEREAWAVTDALGGCRPTTRVANRSGSAGRVWIEGDVVVLGDVGAADAHVEAVRQAVARAAPRWIAVSDVEARLDALGDAHLAATRRIRSAPETVAAFRDALARLVAEGLPIQPFAPLVDRYATLASPPTDPLELAEALRPAVVWRWLRARAPVDPIEVIRVHPEIESIVMDCVKGTGEARRLVIPRDLDRDLGASLDRIGDLGLAIVVCRARVRPWIRELLEARRPGWDVLSRDDVGDAREVREVAVWAPPWVRPPPQ